MYFPTSWLGSLDIGRRALVAHQIAIATAGQNLANAATAGYARQRAELAPIGPYRGVEVTTIRRVRDRFLDFALLTEQQELGRLQARQAFLDRLQAVVNDPPGTGLSDVLDQFFASLQELSVQPADQALRVTVRDRAERVAATFRGMRARLDQLRTDLDTEVRSRLAEANALIGEIAEANRQVIAARHGLPPNDLLDRRDRLIRRLAELVGVTVQDNADGSVRVDLAGSGVFLVDGTATAALTGTYNPATDTIDLAAGGTAVAARGGALAAALEARNAPGGPLKQARADLDALAAAVIVEVNALHASGAGTTGHAALTSANAVSSAAVPLTAAGLAFPPGSGTFRVIVHDAAGAVLSSVTVPVTAGVTTLEDVRAALDADPYLGATVSGGRLTLTATAGATFAFADDTSGTLAALGLNTLFTGATAADIALDPVIASDVTKIAAARADAAGLVHPGDGANALALARLRTALAMNGGTDTFTDFYGTLVSRVGSDRRDTGDAADRQQDAVRLVETLQQQVSGVSTDEELIALTQSQHAYEAAARFVRTVDELLQTLLGIVR